MADNSTHRGVDSLAFLAGGGEMGRRTREFDWSANPLGPIEGWPQSLRSALSICLNSNFPIAIYWGADLVLLYNDEWSPIPGEKHPWAFGRPAREAWPEIWHIIEPLFQKVMATGEATRSRDQLLPMHRHGFTEECYFDYTFSPIRGEGGQVEGVFNAVLETTTRVIGERRLRTLRELGAWKTGEARTAEEACRTATHVIAQNPHDLPFTLLYLLDGGGRRATLAGLTGLDRDTKASPAAVDLDSPDAPWPFRRVADTGKAVEVDGLPARFGSLSGGAWPESPERAVVLPIAKSGQTDVAGFVVAGVSPRLRLDDDYRGFLDLLAGHVAAAVASARAYEEERKRAEALAELDRAKTAFFSNVSHEFRTPLTLMLGPVEDALADAESGLPPAQRERVEVVHRNGLRLQRLVNALLDFSRIEAGRVRATFEPTDLAAFTADLASNFRSACEKAGLTLTVDCSLLGEPVFVDRPMWEKVVLNLLSNAFKFTLDGGIAVELRRAGQWVELRVRDTGTGVPAEEMPRLFERFHRVENARGRTHEGSGIGLALVQELVKLHGGSITAESEVGTGTTFTVTMPLGADHLPRERVGTGHTTASTTGASPFVEEALRWLPDAGESPSLGLEPSTPHDLSPPALPPDAERPRVLVADDNADMRRYVGRLLAGAYRVEAVPDGAAALECVRRQPPDLILSDVMMPRLDGFGLLRELRADPRTASLPVILLSARAGEESRVEGMQAGADDYLVKPFSGKELLARVGSLVQIARLRRESEAAIRASERRLRGIFEQTTAGIVQVDQAGRFLLVNQRFCEMTGYAEGELRGMTCGGLTHPDDRARDQSMFEAALADRQPYVIEKRYVRKDGTTIWVRNSVSEFTDDTGRPQHFLAVSIDITDSKRAEALQAGQRGILEMIAGGAPLADVLGAVCRVIEDQEPGLLCSILLTDEGGRHTGTGFGPSLPTEFVKALEGIDIAPPHTGSCCQALDCGEEVLVADIENDRRWSPLWRDLNLSHGLRACRSIPITGSDGRVLASVAVFRRQPGDPGPANKQLLGIATHLAGVAIERRRAEGRLASELEALTRLHALSTRLLAADDLGTALADVLESAVETCGADFGNVQVLNPQTEALEIAAQRGFREDFLDHFRTVRAADGSACGQALVGDGPVMIEDVQVDPSYEPHRRAAAAAGYRAVRSTPLKTHGGALVGVLSTHFRAPRRVSERDERFLDLYARHAAELIERLRYERALQDADRRKDEFLATLAHELRNPLAPIRNGLQIMRLSNGEREAVEKARTMMERQLSQMVHLVDDLLDLSRISRGKIELRKERVELAKVVQQAVETSRPQIEANGHDLTITVPPGPVYVDADVTRLAQVFSNLLNNAAKCTERGGRVELAVRRQGGEVMVSVKDNGVGIPAHMLPRVFEMFTQVDRHLERSQGGLGIGLSIVKKLVEMHGGGVGVESDGPGTGSEFTVRLPVVLSVAQPTGGDEEPARPSSRRRVLVVDDNEDAAMSLAMMLNLMGNEARTAHDGLEALDVGAAYRPDLILLDIGMPRLNGHDTARRIREQPWGKGVALVALTGWGQEEDRRKSQEAGFDSHITKPIEPAVLEKLLASLKADTA